MFTKEANLFLQYTTQTQLQPIIGRLFLVSPCVIPHYKISPIKTSVHAQDDTFFRIQCIARDSYKELIDNSQLIDEFEQIYEGFTFVYFCDDTETTQ